MDNKKKIIVNATCASKQSTGVGIFTKELISKLTEMSPEMFYTFGVCDFLHEFKNKKIISERCSPDYGSRGHFLRILWSQTQLPIEYRRRGGGLLFSTLPEAPIIIKNKVVVVHDIIPVKFPESLPKMKYYYYYIVPKILKTSRHIVFDSESTKRDVFNYYNLKNLPNSVIPAGYDRKSFYPMESGLIKKKYGFDKYFFFVGDMRPYKNLKNSIHSFARANLDNVFFLIAGKKDEKYFPDIKKAVEDSNLQERIIFLDYIPREDLPHFYRDAIALFFPSKYEGFGLPPLEAMATGTPVITAKMASIPEVCGDAALYIDPDDIDEMAGSLRQMHVDNQLREFYSALSIKQASKFGWEKTAKEYMDLLTGLIQINIPD